MSSLFFSRISSQKQFRWTRDCFTPFQQLLLFRCDPSWIYLCLAWHPSLKTLFCYFERKSCCFKMKCIKTVPSFTVIDKNFGWIQGSLCQDGMPYLSKARCIIFQSKEEFHSRFHVDSFLLTQNIQQHQGSLVIWAPNSEFQSLDRMLLWDVSPNILFEFPVVFISTQRLSLMSIIICMHSIEVYIRILTWDTFPCQEEECDTSYSCLYHVQTHSNLIREFVGCQKEFSDSFKVLESMPWATIHELLLLLYFHDQSYDGSARIT